MTNFFLMIWKRTSQKSGDNSVEVTPVPIPNTVVKLNSADDTWWEAAWESRKSPVFIFFDLESYCIKYVFKLMTGLEFFLCC